MTMQLKIFLNSFLFLSNVMVCFSQDGPNSPALHVVSENQFFSVSDSLVKIPEYKIKPCEIAIKYFNYSSGYKYHRVTRSYGYLVISKDSIIDRYWIYPRVTTKLWDTDTTLTTSSDNFSKSQLITKKDHQWVNNLKKLHGFFIQYPKFDGKEYTNGNRAQSHIVIIKEGGSVFGISSFWFDDIMYQRVAGEYADALKRLVRITSKAL